MNHQANNFSFSLNYLYTVKQKGAEKKLNYKYGKFVWFKTEFSELRLVEMYGGKREN